ncbi:MAG: hypothetical protein Q8O42_12600 [Acidobacteriota bacterium]|nr:hypothetical protein [Acidobacteriota bacterium]
MRSPGAAIAWEFRHHHRWAPLVLVIYWVTVGSYRLFVFEPVEPIQIAPPDGLAALIISPFSVGFLYLLAVFSFGLSGDLAARQSIYPPRMFTLPVTTRALAGWPMLFGTVAAAGLWVATALFAKWPWGVDLPMVWPAVLAAVFLAWTQVLMWMPYSLPGLRVGITVLWLVMLDVIVILAFHFNASPALMVGFLAPQLPLAFGAACWAVARARRGHVPDWRGFSSMGGRRIEVARRLPPFDSPARAQRWIEWRQHGWTLPGLVAMLLPFELALLFIPGNDTRPVVFTTLIVALLTPAVMAGFVAATVSKTNPHARDFFGMSPFMATRSLTSTALVAAKLHMATWSTLASWLLVVLAIPLGLVLSDTFPVVTEWTRGTADVLGAPRAAAAALLVLLGLIVTTWSLLVQNMYIGLTGREWLIKSSVLLTLALVIAAVPLVQWVIKSGEAQAAIWDGWPAVVAVLAGIKMTAAAWSVMRLHSSRLLSSRALVTAAACWCVAVLAVYGVLAWFFSTPLVPRYLLALIAILAIPLARVSAAPLALAWNRHR